MEALPPKVMLSGSSFIKWAFDMRGAWEAGASLKCVTGRILVTRVRESRGAGEFEEKIGY